MGSISEAWICQFQFWAYCFHQKAKKTDITININGVDLHPSKTAKYLGVVLDEKLTWRAHMEQKCPTTTRTILELRRYSKLTWGPNIRVLERIFLSIAEPMLLYAVQVWITATKVRWCITKLWSVQRLMLMTITRSFRSISTRSALVLTNSLPMEKKGATHCSFSYFKK